MFKCNIPNYIGITALTTLAAAMLYHMEDINTAITVMFRL